jgi:hypothetical protein
MIKIIDCMQQWQSTPLLICTLKVRIRQEANEIDYFLVKCLFE